MLSPIPVTCILHIMCGDESCSGPKNLDIATIYNLPGRFPDHIVSCRSIFQFSISRHLFTRPTRLANVITGFRIETIILYRGVAAGFTFFILFKSIYYNPNYEIALPGPLQQNSLPRPLSAFPFPRPCSNPIQYRAVVHPRNATRTHPVPRNIIYPRPNSGLIL